MLGKLGKKLTNNYNEVPLFHATFNLNRYLEEGEKGSCDLKMHPTFREDEFITEQLKGLIEHIRENYDMEDLSKI